MNFYIVTINLEGEFTTYYLGVKAASHAKAEVKALQRVDATYQQVVNIKSEPIN